MKLTTTNIQQTLLLALITIAGFIVTEFSLQTTVHATSTSGFNTGRIIDDSVFTNNSSMNATQIQAFLNSKVTNCDTNGTQIATEYGSSLTHAQYAASKGWSTPPYTCLKDYSENGISSAQIIFNIAQQYQINPQVLLVLLQKEQGLVTDTWPLATQYRAATGYGCPDTAACSTTYYGFSNQLTWSATMFHAIITNNPNWYTPYVLGNNYIQWNPNSSCGGTNVNIQNRSTQALYNYTPYQPNQAALNAGYGTGDSCSAYGNRNFFLYFTDWFGTTFNEISLQQSTSSPTVYVVYDNHKQGIPSPDVLLAWGLDKLPVYIVNDVSLAAIPDTGVLTRLARNPYNTNMLLLADNGGFFNAWPNAIQNYGFDPNSASNIGLRLLTMTSWSTNLSPFFTSPKGTGVYMADNGASHQFSSGNILSLWAGDSPVVISLSDALYSHLTPSTGIFTNDSVTNSGTHYLSDNGHLYTVPQSIASNYATTNPITVSSALLSVLPQNGNLTQFVQNQNSPTIYLVDAYKLHGFTSGDVLSSFLKDSSTTITNLSQKSLSLLEQASPISNRYVYNSTNNNSYYLNKSLSSLGSHFNAVAYGTPLSSDTLATYGGINQKLDCGSGNGFIQAQGESAIYMLEDGKKRPIANLNDFNMLNDSRKVCTISPVDVNVIPTANQITPFVTNTSTSYILEGAKRYTVSTSALSILGVTTTPVSSSTLQSYSDSGTFNLSFKTDNTNYAYIDNGFYYTTNNPAVVALWSLNGSQTHPQLILNLFKNGGLLGQFAGSSDSSNKSIYVVDNGKFLPIYTMNGLINAGPSGQNTPRLLDSTIIGHLAPSTWQGYLATNGTGSFWVFDGGVKRSIASQYLSAWQTTQSTTLSESYLSLLSNGSAITDAIKSTSQPIIYGLKNGKKYGIPSPSIYTLSGLSAVTIVSDSLLNSVPDGGIWSN